MKTQELIQAMLDRKEVLYKAVLTDRWRKARITAVGLNRSYLQSKTLRTTVCVANHSIKI